MNIRTKRGLTMIESMLALTALGVTGAGMIKYQQSENEINLQKQTGIEFNQIINAFDNRLLIDGYDDNLWTSMTFNNTNFQNELLKNAFTATNSRCSGTWNPRIAQENTTELVSCGLWQEKIPYGLIPSAEIGVDSTGFIDTFEVRLSFENQEDFDRNINNVRKALFNASANAKNLTGVHSFGFVDGRNPENFITNIECVGIKEDCEASLRYQRGGGFEGLRADGQNSMVADHLTFVEAIGQEPMLCRRMFRNDDGDWLSEEVECGIGIYNSVNAPVTASLSLESGTFEDSVVLDRMCQNWIYNNTTRTTILNPDVPEIPCGFINETEAIAVVDNSIATSGRFVNLETETMIVNTGDLNALTVTGLSNLSSVRADSIIASNINADVVEINTELKNNGKTTLKELVVEGKSTFKERVSFNKTATFNDLIANTARIPVIAGDTTFLNDVKSNGNITANGNIYGKSIFVDSASISSYDDKFQDLEARIELMEHELKPAPPSEPDYSALKSSCNSKSDEEYSRSYPGRCSPGLRYMHDFFWRDDIKTCDKRSYTVVWKSQTSSNKECVGGGR